MLQKLRKIARRLKGLTPKTGGRHRKHYVVYASILGGYDDLPGLAQIDDDLSYVCFTDTPERFEGIHPWQIVPVESFFRDKKLMNGYLKANSDILFGVDTVSVWVDGNLSSLMLSKVYLEALTTQASVAVPPHLLRSTVESEIEVVLEVGLEPHAGVETMRQTLLENQYPDQDPLSATMLLMRDHTDPAVLDANRIWSRTILSGVRRDQLSFDFSLWMAGVKPFHLELDWLEPNFLFDRGDHKNPINRTTENQDIRMLFPPMPSDYPEGVTYIEESFSQGELEYYRSLNSIVRNKSPEGRVEGNYCHFNDSKLCEFTPPDLRRSWKREYLRKSIKGSRNVLEIGFNAGHSSVLMKEAAPEINLTSVDIGFHPYVKPCANYLSQVYLSEFKFLMGDSRKVIQELNLHDYDFVHIDGGHGHDVFAEEVKWFCENAKPGTRTLVDDAYVSYIRHELDKRLDDGELIAVEGVLASSGENRLFQKT